MDSFMKKRLTSIAISLSMLLSLFCSDLATEIEEEEYTKKNTMLELHVHGKYWGDTLVIYLDDETISNFPFIVDSSKEVDFRIGHILRSDSSYQIESVLKRDGTQRSASKAVETGEDELVVSYSISFDSTISITGE